MIRSKDLNTEITKFDALADPKVTPNADEKELLRALVKGNALILKVMRDIKTNQVKHLQHLGIKLIAPREDSKKNRTERKGFGKKVIE